MFHARHRVRRLHRLHRLGNLGYGYGGYGGGYGSWANFGDFSGLGTDSAGFGRARRRLFGGRRRRRGLGAARILLAGLAVFLFARLLSAANGSNRSTAEKVLLGMGLAAVGALLLSLRRSAARSRW
jgi:hypothetical protein